MRLLPIYSNPQGTATGTLTKLGIGSDIYEIQGGGGSSTLAGLSDVDITSPSDGQILQYDATSQKWVNHVNAPEYISVTVDVYSAASDTVSFADRTGAKTVTTDTNGHGTATIVCFNGDSITFTSSVAKNPSNLSQAYSKTVTIGANITEIYVMPDTAIYWFGYESSNFVIPSTSEGYSNTSGYTYTAPTKNTNYYQCNTTNANGSLIASKNPISNVNSIHAICDDVQSSSSKIFMIVGDTRKNFVDTGTRIIKDNTISTMTHVELNNTLTGDIYIGCGEFNLRNGKAYALWYE